MSAVWCTAFDLAGQIGVATIRVELAGQMKRKPNPSSTRVKMLDCIAVPNAEDDEFKGKDAAVRARIHSPLVWDAVSQMFRTILLDSFTKAHGGRDGHLVIAYEKVVFASSVFWAHFYGGLVATLMQVTNREFGNLKGRVTLVGVNVSRAKSMLTGDSGAPKDVVADALEPFLTRMEPRARKQYESIPEKLRHNSTDALAVAIAAVQIASEKWDVNDDEVERIA